jgi:hypothetical protein
MPPKYLVYPPGDIKIMKEINFYLRKGVDTLAAGIPDIPIDTEEYRSFKKGYWPDPDGEPNCRGSKPPLVVKPLPIEGGSRKRKQPGC